MFVVLQVDVYDESGEGREKVETVFGPFSHESDAEAFVKSRAHQKGVSFDIFPLTPVE
jgi:hypothetical protein